MSGTPNADADYKVVLDKKRAEAALFSLNHDAGFIEATTFINEYLPKTPKQMHPPKLKELKGVYKGIYQFDFAGNHRLLYRVDDETRTVLVDEIGPHPDWTKRRGGSQRRKA